MLLSGRVTLNMNEAVRSVPSMGEKSVISNQKVGKQNEPLRVILMYGSFRTGEDISIFPSLKSRKMAQSMWGGGG